MVIGIGIAISNLGDRAHALMLYKYNRCFIFNGIVDRLINKALKASSFGIPYRIDIYELLNRTSSRIVRVALEIQIVLPSKVKIKNSTS